MKRSHWLLIMALLSALGLGARVQPTLAAPAGADIPGGGDPNVVGALAIRTDGVFVAWSEEIQPNRFMRYANLYVAATGDTQPTLVSSQLVFANYIGPLTPGFDLDRGTLVWIDTHDNIAPPFPLRARDLRTGEVKTITEAVAAFPTISGDTVVWWEDLGWAARKPRGQLG